MAVAAEAHYRELGILDRVTGFTTAPHGTPEALAVPRPSVIEIVSARHPTPDEASVQAAERALGLVATATERDLVLVLLSGGASALWAAPAAGLTLAAKTGLTRGLLKCGADIHEMNTVRRHVSRIKGGRLRKATAAPMLTLAISDVPGDDPATIGSGPTVPDPTTLADARAVLDRRRPAMQALGLAVPPAVDAALADPANETPKPGDPAFASAEYRIIATPAAVARRRGCAGQAPRLRGGRSGRCASPARRARWPAPMPRSRARPRPPAAGSPSSAAASFPSPCATRRAAAGATRNMRWRWRWRSAALAGISALAADTDGIDGGTGQVTDPAGAMIDAGTLAGGAPPGRPEVPRQ